jgi:hypothetical protein
VRPISAISYGEISTLSYGLRDDKTWGSDIYEDGHGKAMWLPGHLAIGLLLSLFALALYARGHRPLLLPLAFVAFFSVLPDFLHIGGLRAFSHSILGATVLLVVALVVLLAMRSLTPLLALVAAISLYSHLLADIWIGHIYPWWPWSDQIVQNNPFNTIYDLRVELLLSFLAFVPFAWIILRRPRDLRIESSDRRDLLPLTMLMGLFFVFCLAQTVYFIDLDILTDPTISAVLLLLVFLGSLIASLIVLVGSFRRIGKESIIPLGNRFSEH